MSVKILHAADFHMDSPFESLPEEKALVRRREQREGLLRLAETVNENGVEVVLLSGDLFDSSASCFETGETLVEALSAMKAEVFISPGNHDCISRKSPYSYLEFPENVHIFRERLVSCVELPEIGCRVWGAGMTSSESPNMLRGFSAPPSDYIELMTLHGDITGGAYGPLTEHDIAVSGLDYLALGHIHSFSGIKTAGKTAYAYPGCPEGRGFDETGEKGVIIGTVDRQGCDLKFLPTCRRRYRVLSADMTGEKNALEAVKKALSAGDFSDDICRIVLTGEFSGRIDTEQLENGQNLRAFYLTVRSETHLPHDIWSASDDDTLTGLFVRRMRRKYEEAPEKDRHIYELAVRYGLAALENREEWRP